MESTARDVFWTITNWFTVLMMASWGKKQKDCHLQALKSPRVLNFSATKTMESSSTNPKTIHGTDIFVCAPTFTHKKFNQVMYRWVNIQSSTWIYKICVTRCFAVVFRLRLLFPVTPSTLRYSTLESIQRASHVGYWSERNSVGIVISVGWFPMIAMYMYISITRWWFQISNIIFFHHLFVEDFQFDFYFLNMLKPPASTIVELYIYISIQWPGGSIATLKNSPYPHQHMIFQDLE